MPHENHRPPRRYGQRVTKVNRSVTRPYSQTHSNTLRCSDLNFDTTNLLQTGDRCGVAFPARWGREAARSITRRLGLVLRRRNVSVFCLRIPALVGSADAATYPAGLAATCIAVTRMSTAGAGSHLGGWTWYFEWTVVDFLVELGWKWLRCCLAGERTVGDGHQRSGVTANLLTVKQHPHARIAAASSNHSTLV